MKTSPSSALISCSLEHCCDETMVSKTRVDRNYVNRCVQCSNGFSGAFCLESRKTANSFIHSFSYHHISITPAHKGKYINTVTDYKPFSLLCIQQAERQRGIFTAVSFHYHVVREYCRQTQVFITY